MDLYIIDRSVFLFLNAGAANPVFDIVMPFVTDADNWKIPLLLGWLALVIFGGKKGRTAAILAVFVLTLSDQVSSAWLKPLIGRTRPCFAVEGARLLIKQSPSFSFPSSHAANNAALAMLFTCYYPKQKWIFIGVAALVGYSRIYVGVHYPSDVIGGAMTGVLCALVIMGLYSLLKRLWQQYRKESAQTSIDEGDSE